MGAYALVECDPKNRFSRRRCAKTREATTANFEGLSTVLD